jgi:hypothetical protein
MENTIQSSQSSQYLCHLCNKGFTRLRNLEYHLNHNVCQQKEEEYQRQSELAYRTCFICNPAKIFANRPTFRNHIKRIHQFNILADYEQFISNINHWSAEIEDDWGLFICRNPQWMNRDWLRSRWDHLFSNNNRFFANWDNLENRLVIEEDILLILTTLFQEIDDSTFDESAIIFPNSPTPHNKIYNSDEEMKWLEFFSALPPDIGIWNFVYNRFIHFYKQMKSPYKQKKWIYPIHYWNIWLRWCRVMIHKSHFKIINIESLIEVYQVYFDISDHTPMYLYNRNLNANQHSIDSIKQQKIILEFKQ